MKKHKRGNDPHLTKHGRGVDISTRDEDAIEYFTVICHNCHNSKAKHKKVISKNAGRRYSIVICQSCGFRRFWKWIDESPSSDDDLDRQSKLIQALNESLWGWVRNHIDEVVKYESNPKLHLFIGRIGNPRRNKGKPYFSSSLLHPEFIKYLETPEAIKQLANGLNKLDSEDIALYMFIVLRSNGLSYKMIDELKLDCFESELSYYRKPTAQTLGNTASNYGRKLNRNAIAFFLSILPLQLTQSFGNKSTKSLAVKRLDNREDRLVCPKCGGTDNTCSLCKDGTVPRWLSEKYQDRIARGDIWED